MKEYDFRCRPARVIDGDTIILAIDHGFYLNSQQRFRLKGVAAPRIQDYSDEADAGIKSKKYVMDWFREHRHQSEGDEMFPFSVTSIKIGRYGRFLAKISCSQGHTLNEDLVRDEMVEVYQKPDEEFGD